MTANKEKLEPVSLATGWRFVESVRESGITAIEAVQELIDNSLDHGNSNNVYVTIYDDSDGVTIIEQDDGKGILPERINRSLRFGETTVPEMHPGISKFGFGLSLATTGMTRYSEIFSKEPDKDWWCATLDLDEITKDENMLIQPAKKKSPIPAYNKYVRDLKSGTVVVLKNCDKVHMPAKQFANKIKKEIGRTYRKFIASGISIYVNGEKLLPMDPLMLMKDHYYAAKVGYGQAFGEFDSIEVPYKDKNGEERKGLVRIKLSILPLEKIRDYEEYNPDEKLGINMRKQGFYIMRNGREIASARSLDLFTKHNQLNCFRGEIEFSTELDTLFGVQFNKSRFDPNPKVKELLNKALGTVIGGTIYRALKRRGDLHTNEKHRMDKDDIAENVALEASKMLRKPESAKISDKEAEAEEKRILADIDKATELTPEQKMNKKAQIKEIFEKRFPFVLEFESYQDAPFYRTEPLGRTTRVIVNMDHPFYKYYIEPFKTKHFYERTLIKLFLFMLAKGELLAKDIEKGFNHDSLRIEWSVALNVFLTTDGFEEFFKNRDELQEEEDDEGDKQ